MESSQVLKVRLMSEDGRIPRVAKEGSIGYDLSSAIDAIVPAHGRIRVPIGISLELPFRTYGRIAPRSSLAMKSIDVCAGVIDPGYTGEIAVVLANHSDSDYSVRKLDRIAQLILEMALVLPVVDVTAIQRTETTRGGYGFGSTGH